MNRIGHLSGNKNPWGKSFTPKRYIHAPFSENIITMWPNGSIVIGEIAGGPEPQVFSEGRIAESKLPSCMISFLYHDQLPDFKAAEYKTRADGIPVHSLVHNMDDFSMEIDSFCNSERVSTAFARVTVKNTSDALSHSTFVIFPFEFKFIVFAPQSCLAIIAFAPHV